MAAQGMIRRYLGLAESAERALADAFTLVGARHAAEPEIRNAAHLNANWCQAHRERIQAAAERYGTTRSAEGERLRRAMFRGRRVGGFGLLRDLHDLLVLAGFVHTCWDTLRQAAAQRRDMELVATCEHCDAEARRQIAWLETKVRHAAPQALTVAPVMSKELRAAIPHAADLAVVARRLPMAALRRAQPLPGTGALLVAAVALAALALGRRHLAGGRR